MKNNRLVMILLTALGVLAIPFVAMQFTDSVQWGLFDFTVAAVLLFGTGLLVELVLRKVSKTLHRVAICVGLLTMLLLIWVELAVGVFGTALAGS